MDDRSLNGRDDDPFTRYKGESRLLRVHEMLIAHLAISEDVDGYLILGRQNAGTDQTHISGQDIGLLFPLRKRVGIFDGEACLLHIDTFLVHSVVIVTRFDRRKALRVIESISSVRKRSKKPQREYYHRCLES